MASNPMQKKARNSFLAGMVLMLFLSSIVIVFLFLKLNSSKKQTDTGVPVSVYVLKQDVKSGEEITQDKLELVQVQKQVIPTKDKGKSQKQVIMQQVVASDAINQEVYSKFSVTADAEPNYNSNNGTNTNQTNDEAAVREQKWLNEVEKEVTNVTGVNVATKYVAKTDLTTGTILTNSMIQESERRLTADLRLQEFNMIQLPSDLAEGEYVDIRFTIPSGQDYIVISKKKIMKASETTIWIELNEDEILTMTNAIIEAYIMKGSNLYATRYVEPGLQEVLTPTYPVNKEVMTLMENDPNIADTAKRELYARYNTEQRNNGINNALNEYSEEAKSSIESKIQEQVTNAKAERKKYIEELNAAATAAASAQANGATAATTSTAK